MARVEICGGIASGKTTLAQILSDLDCVVLLEDFSANPFWSAFYTEPGRHVFETEVTFALLHYHQIHNADGSPVVCDFSSLLDLAYADIGLQGERHRLFEDIVQELRRDIGLPSLVIQLDCTAEVEFERIRRRSRREEETISLEFLRLLNAAVLNRSNALRRQGIETIAIDTTSVDYRNEPARTTILQQIKEVMPLPGT